MSKPYDAATKRLLETYPADWLALLGLHQVEVETIDAELSTVTAAADRVFRVKSADPYLVNVEPQSGFDTGLATRLLQYAVLLHVKYGLPVLSLVLLLHRRAEDVKLSGRLDLRLPAMC